jgi:hypothetical protein
MHIVDGIGMKQDSSLLHFAIEAAGHRARHFDFCIQQIAQLREDALVHRNSDVSSMHCQFQLRHLMAGTPRKRGRANDTSQNDVPAVELRLNQSTKVSRDGFWEWAMVKKDQVVTDDDGAEAVPSDAAYQNAIAGQEFEFRRS